MKLTRPLLIVAAAVMLSACAAPAPSPSSASLPPVGGTKDVSLSQVLAEKVDAIAACGDVFGDPTQAAKQVFDADMAAQWTGRSLGVSWVCHLFPAGNDQAKSLIDFEVNTDAEHHAGEVPTAGGARLYFLTLSELTADQGKRVVEWQKAAASHIQK